MEKNLQKEENELAPETGETCGGKKKPAIPPGEVGDWECVGDEWTWVPFIGK